MITKLSPEIYHVLSRKNYLKFPIKLRIDKDKTVKGYYYIFGNQTKIDNPLESKIVKYRNLSCFIKKIYFKNSFRKFQSIK